MQQLDTSVDHEDKDIARAIAGDVNAFQRLYQTYVGKVYGLVLRLCGDRSQADDMVQEVFIQLWQKLANFRGDSKFSTWLHAVATNVTLTELRKQKRWYQRIIKAGQQVQQEADSGAMDLSELDRYVMKLPDQTRWVFVLAALEGMRHEEIADQLGIAVGTSKAQLHRAKQLIEEWANHDAA